MSVVALVAFDPKFYAKDLPQKKMWKTVSDQVTNHTRRKERNELVDTLRPNESEAIKKYRKKNHRQLTKSSITEMYRMLGRIFMESGLSLEFSSDELTDWLATKPFYYLGQRMDLWDFFFKCVLPMEDEDPNSILFARPYNKDNPFVPPYLPFSEGGKEKNKTIDIIVEQVPSERIVFVPTYELQVFAWHGGQKEIQINGNASSEKWYWLVDEDWWYRYVPVRHDAKEGVIYELEKWYPHDTGMEIEKILPVVVANGELTTSEDGSYKYHESNLRPALEYFDEFTARHSDFQVILNRFSFPKEIFNGSPTCTTCKGKTQIKYSHDAGRHNSKTCPDCQGTGIQADASPTGRYYRENKGLEGGNSRPLFEYIMPPAEVSKNFKEIIFDYKSMGERKIGIGLLVNTNESGKAKEIRLQPSQDQLRTRAMGSFGGTMKNLLFFAECLLQVNRNKRVVPIVNLPVTYKLSDAQELTEQAKNTFAANRLQAQMRVIEKENKGNNEAILLYQLAYAYAPLLSSTEEEISNRIDIGSYPSLALEVIKRDNVIRLLHEYTDGGKRKLMDSKKEDVFNFLDAEVEKLLAAQPTVQPLVDNG